jgi:hypothetical protein
VLGEYDKDLSDTPKEQFVLQLKDNQFKEILLPGNKSEYILGSAINKSGILLYTQFPGVYGDLNKYLKISYFNTKSNTTRTAYTYFKDARWEEMSLGGYADKDAIWVIAKDLGKPDRHYLQINNKGEQVAVIPTSNIGNNIVLFIIEKERQIQVVDGKLKITREPVQGLQPAGR